MSDPDYAQLKRVKLLREALAEAVDQLENQPAPEALGEVLLGIVVLDRDPDSEDYNRIVVYPVTGPFDEPYPVSFDPYRTADASALGAVLNTEAQVFLEPPYHHED